MNKDLFNEKYTVSDLPDGIILWRGEEILEVKGMCLPIQYMDRKCVSVPGNKFDYELVIEPC